MSVFDATDKDFIPISRPYQAFTGWCRLAAAAIVLAMFFVAVPDDNLAGVVRLERFAYTIEDASAVSPEARRAIRRLVVQQSEIVGLNPTHEIRRKAAIERVDAALKATESTASGSRLISSNLKTTGD